MAKHCVSILHAHLKLGVLFMFNFGPLAPTDWTWPALPEQASNGFASCQFLPKGLLSRKKSWNPGCFLT